MEYKSLKHNFKLPVIGLGTWGIGGYVQADYSQDEESVEVIKDALDFGYSHIDTAELYGAGHTSELIGEAIKNYERSKVIITDKVYKTNLKYEDVIIACEKSLERLQTDYIDIYLLHSPSKDIPIQGTMKALDYLVKQKMVKHIGVSNFSVDQMKEAQQFSQNKIKVNQIPYNLATRNESTVFSCKNMESEIIPYCQENDIMIMAFWPLAGEFLLQPHLMMDELSQKYGKTKAQIALNWLISKKNIVVIPKSIKKDHLQENLGAIGWKMSEDDLKLLNNTNFFKPNSQYPEKRY